MGLFSKKKRITVAVRTFNLLKAEPSITKDTILGAVLQDIPLSRALINSMGNGFNYKADRYYSYGAKYHPDGLPRALYVNFDLETDIVNRVIDIWTGSSPSRVIHSYSIEPANAFNIAYSYMVGAYKWDSVTNTIPNSAAKFDRAEFIENNTKIRIFFSNTTPPYVDVPMAYQVEDGELFLYAEVTDPRLSDGLRTMFIYRMSTLLIPELYPNSLPATPYYPITVLRHNKVNVDADKSSQRYKRTVKLINKLGMDLDEVMAGIMSREEGNNPDNLDECFLTFSVNLSTKNTLTLGYLAEYFLSVSNQGLNKQEFEEYLLNPYGQTPYTGIQLAEQDFNISLGWNYIHVERKEGKPWEDIKYKHATMSTVRRGTRYTRVGGDYNASDLILTYRNSKTSYLVITINGLEHGVDVYEGRYVVNSIDTINNSADGADSIFIPINKTVLKKFSPVEQSEILMDCLNMVVYAVQITHLRWYQRSKLVKIIGLVITIAVAIIYPPAGLAGATTMAAITAVVTQIIIQMILAQILIKGAEFVGGLLGSDIAQLLAMVTAITAIVISPTNIAMASDLLQIVTGLNMAVGKDLVKKMKDLLSESEKFFEELSLKGAEIESALSTLVQESTLSQIKKSIGLINQNETVEEYFNRTYYNTDITELTFAMVNYRIESLLQLPKPTVI